AAVSLIEKGHKLLAGDREAVTMGDEVGDFGCGHRAVQTVRAKHKNVGGKQLKVVRVDADEQVSSERAAEHVAGLDRGRFPARKQPQADLFAGDGMVARERRNLAAADKITARVAYVGHHRTIEAQSTGDDSG